MRVFVFVRSAVVSLCVLIHDSLLFYHVVQEALLDVPSVCVSERTITRGHKTTAKSSHDGRNAERGRRKKCNETASNQTTTTSAAKVLVPVDSITDFADWLTGIEKQLDEICVCKTSGAGKEKKTTGVSLDPEIVKVSFVSDCLQCCCMFETLLACAFSFFNFPVSVCAPHHHETGNGNSEADICVCLISPAKLAFFFMRIDGMGESHRLLRTRVCACIAFLSCLSVWVSSQSFCGICPL